jgi:hypothetical protein
VINYESVKTLLCNLTKVDNDNNDIELDSIIHSFIMLYLCEYSDLIKNQIASWIWNIDCYLKQEVDGPEKEIKVMELVSERVLEITKEHISDISSIHANALIISVTRINESSLSYMLNVKITGG